MPPLKLEVLLRAALECPAHALMELRHEWAPGESIHLIRWRDEEGTAHPEPQ